MNSHFIDEKAEAQGDKWPIWVYMADVYIQVSKLASLAPEDFPVITGLPLKLREESRSAQVTLLRGEA